MNQEEKKAAKKVYLQNMGFLCKRIGKVDAECIEWYEEPAKDANATP